jgi:SSS family solute:Na+ symporter
MLWQRGTTRGALASIALGILSVGCSLLLWGVDSDLPIYVGLSLSLAAYLGVSLGSGGQPSSAVTDGNV